MTQQGKQNRSSTNVSLSGHSLATEVASSRHDNRIRLLLLRGQGQAGDGGVPKEWNRLSQECCVMDQVLVAGSGHGGISFRGVCQKGAQLTDIADGDGPGPF
eukprot:8170880-Ditylum_brightwellii.AAC.1